MRFAVAGRVLFLCFLLGVPADQTVAEAVALRERVNALFEADDQQRRELLRELAASGDERVPAVFEALARGALYLDRRSDDVVIAERRGARYELRDVLTGNELAGAGRRDVRRLRVDNRLREELASLAALRGLVSTDVGERRSAVRTIAAAPSALALETLRGHLARETDASVRDEIELTLAIAALSASGSAVSDALATLEGRSEARVRAALAAFLERDDLNSAQREEAQAALRKTELRLRWLARLEALFFGLSLGSVLLLCAIGLSITFGVMGVINMAHGELIMLGAYASWGAQQLLPGQPGLALLLSIPAAFLFCGFVGLLLERGVIRHLYGRPLETLLATFGISLILQQAVRSLVSPLNRSVVTPSWLSGAWEIAPGLALTYNRIAILLFSLLTFALLLALLRFTRLGLQLRAVAQNRAMARALGVRSGRVDAMTFALGSGVAGLAGVALSQLTNVGPNLGQAYIIDSFLVVVFGGVGNLWGTLVAAFSLGVANKLLEPAAGAVLAKILLLVGLILFLQRRPQGLFPRSGRQDTL
ncbi:MAG: urea ABC transporter permease subunit UrtB [Pseudomonadota bacterium]